MAQHFGRYTVPPFVTTPGAHRPEDRIEYFRWLGTRDPLRCERCGKFKSERADPQWRCACAPEVQP